MYCVLNWDSLIPARAHHASCLVPECRGISHADPICREANMGQVLHGSATDDARHPSCDTAIEGSAQRLGRAIWIEPKTVAKWRHRGFVNDAPMGPTARFSREMIITPLITRQKKAASHRHAEP